MSQLSDSDEAITQDEVIERVSTEAIRTTLFQLEALVTALNQGSFERAANKLGYADKHRLIKAVDRLAQNLQFEGLTQRIGDTLVIPPELYELEPSASRVLGAIEDFKRVAETLRTRTTIVRCSAYPSMVTIFIARAAEAFEAYASHRRRVRFVDMESTNRFHGGSAMLRALSTGEVDVAVAPTRALSDADTVVRSEEVYGWNLVAAIHSEHPLSADVFTHGGRTVVELNNVAKYPLLLSPREHKTRELLESAEPLRRLNVELESLNSQARAALGRFGHRVPVIASDALTDHEYNHDWPAVVVPNEAADTFTFLGDTHSVYWRLDLPAPIANDVLDFARAIYDAAAVLRARPGGEVELPKLFAVNR